MSNTTTIPGEGLSYSELCGSANGSEVRTMWSALGDLAEVLGVEVYARSMSPRTKTTDELLADIREVAPEGLDIAAAALATKAMTPEVPRWEEAFEVRRLTVDGTKPGSYRYIVEDTVDTYEEATAIKTHFEEALTETEAIVAIVKVETTTKIDVYPANYVPRR